MCVTIVNENDCESSSTPFQSGMSKRTKKNFMLSQSLLSDVYVGVFLKHFWKIKLDEDSKHKSIRF